MPRAIPEEKVKEVLRLRFQGYSSKEASELSGVNVRTINNKIRDFRKKARRVGFLNAIKEYGLEVDGLFSLALDLKKSGLSMDDCSMGSSIAKTLNELNIDINLFDEFLKDFYFKAKDQGLTGDDIGVAIVQFVFVEKETGVPFLKIADDYKRLFGVVDRLKKESNELQENVDGLRRARNNELKETRTTKEELLRFKETRDSLDKISVPFKDVGRLKILFENVEQHGYDAVKVSDFYSKHAELDKSLNELEASVLHLEEKRDALTEKKTNLDEYLKEKQVMVEAVKSLERQRLEPNDVRVITEAVASISLVQGLSSREAIERFSEEIREHYEPLLNMGEEVKRRKTRSEALKAKLDDYRRNLDILEEVYNSRKNELDKLKALNEAGVSDGDLKEWNEILKEIGIDPPSFRKDMEKLGSIENYIAEKVSRIREINDEIAQLEKIKKALETDLKTLSSYAVKEVKENLGLFKGVLSEFKADFLSAETGLNPQTRKILQTAENNIENLLKTTENSLNNRLGKFQRNLNQKIVDVEKAWDTAYKTGKEVEKYSIVRTITKLVRGERLQKDEAFAAMHIIISEFESWLRRNNEVNLAMGCSGLKSAIEGRLKRGY